MKERRTALCPSAPLSPKAQIFGVITGGGQVAYLGKALAVDADFISEAKKGREPERRFRFAAPCAHRGCANWEGGSCSLPERIGIDLPSDDMFHGPVPECAIRDRCLWHMQSGDSTCKNCRFVVTRAT